jgi:hypothetical protein
MLMAMSFWFLILDDTMMFGRWDGAFASGSIAWRCKWEAEKDLRGFNDRIRARAWHLYICEYHISELNCFCFISMVC